jgi:excinuclease UvrABC ATPase subunit
MNAIQAVELLAGHRDITDRLGWIERVGLGYLAIGQSLDTLSGGERQRLLLARHLGEGHDATTLRIVLDEPTAGLHGTDVDRLLHLFDELIEAGATIIAIEHNLRVIAHADHIIDIGPGAGHNGGTVVFQGSPHDLIHATGSVTSQYLSQATR